MAQEATILDHIDNITVAGDVFTKPANEYWALVCLHYGMEFLYQQALSCDKLVQEKLGPDVQYFGSGNSPIFDGISKRLLTCGFHWYAISACNYVRTVGAIARKLDSTRPLPYEYAWGVIPEVVTFRDKVAAHFAWSTESNRDNDAERLASVLPPLAFQDGSFHVVPWTIAIRRGDTSSTSESIRSWSISRVHETLRKRYWPEELTVEDSNEDTSAP